MEARLVGAQCFVLTMPTQKSLNGSIKRNILTKLLFSRIDTYLALNGCCGSNNRELKQRRF